MTPVWREPIPGWHDNLNGPIGMLVAAAKGVLRTMHCDAKKKSESIPVDVAINSIILTGWKLANSPRSEKPYVVNISPRHVIDKKRFSSCQLERVTILGYSDNLGRNRGRFQEKL